MADLKTTYKDDVLDTSVNEKRKYNMIQNADGTVSFEDVTTYSQIGDSFGAVDINATNKKVNEVNSNLSDLSDELHKNVPIDEICTYNYPSITSMLKYYIDKGYLPSLHEYVPLIPTMTSNTAPSGIASTYPTHTDTSQAAYKAFDGNDSTYSAVANTQNTNEYIQYMFETPVRAVRCCMKMWSGHTTRIYPGLQLRASNDGSNWVVLHQEDVTITTGVGNYTWDFENDTAYKYYQIFSARTLSVPNQYYINWNTIQLYDKP